MKRGQTVAWCRPDGTITNVRLSELLMTKALERVPADEAGPGDIVAIAGIPDIMIGETLADPNDPTPLPLIHVDEPSISMTIGINTSPLAGKVGKQAHRPAGQGPARHRAGRQRVDPGAAHRASRHLGGAGTRRAAAGRPGGDDAPRGLRADRRQAAGADPRDRRQAARAGRAAHRRHSRGARRHGHPADGHPPGAHGADGQPRHRLGAHGVRHPGPRPDRLPHRVPHRDPRHRHHAPRVRGLRAVGRRDQDPPDRLAGRRPHRRR